MNKDIIRISSNWRPDFQWVTREEIADVINRPHEDYPKRIQDTERVIELLFPTVKVPFIPTIEVIKFIHRLIFFDKGFAGRFRTINVTIGGEYPPRHEIVPPLMNLLEQLSFADGGISSLDELKNWYRDFELIHPFQDGNGRTGGVILAIVSNKLNPKKGFLAEKVKEEYLSNYYRLKGTMAQKNDLGVVTEEKTNGPRGVS